MIGLVLVTHGRLAAEFRAALEHVVGPQRQLETIAAQLDRDAEMNLRRSEADRRYVADARMLRRSRCGEQQAEESGQCPDLDHQRKSVRFYEASTAKVSALFLGK